MTSADPMNHAPIFVRGFSRSGGTLLVTVLDAHPDVAMSYELYGHLLACDNALARFQRAVSSTTSLREACQRVGDQGLATFIARADRGGLTIYDLRSLATRLVSPPHSFETESDRLSFIGKCCELKAVRESASCWGLKCANNFEDYLARWPAARFLNVLRDGRDVFASQCNNGAFNTEPEAVAKGWANTFRRFREFAAKYPGQATEVRYEQLVQDTETELRRICGFLNLPFADSMLAHEQQDLTLYRASGHLSMKQVQRPVNAASVGRWPRDLTDEQVERFMAVAGDAMRESGYVD